MRSIPMANKILKKGLLFLLLILVVFLGQKFGDWKKEDPRKVYEKQLANHPYYKRLHHISANESIKISTHQTDRPDLAFLQDFLYTMDPSIGRPTPEVLFPISEKYMQMRSAKTNSFSNDVNWIERGPSLVSGRVRAILFDPNDAQAKKVWAGGVTGGLWFNTDITNASTSWTKVDDFWDNLAISCIAADPNNGQTMYVGTGEFEWTVRGGGIWKTTNGGTTWARLPSSTDFLEIRDIVVRNESGSSVVYAAVKPGFGGDNPPYTGGLYRSTDGGTSWTQVLPLAQTSATRTNLPTDIAIGADNTIWVGTEKHFSVGGATSTIYKSSTGLTNSWTAISSFTGSNLMFNGVIKLATSPSTANTLYAAIEHNSVIGGIFRSTDAGASWTSTSLPVDADTGIPANDFTRGQAWYDLAMAVHPTNSSNCFIGGIDWFASSDMGSNWSQISRWYGFSGTNSSIVHADQHNFIFRPGFPNEAILSNDGGVFYSSNLSSASSSSTAFSARNQNFNITQFYSGALHPFLPDFMLGGTQDNGTPKFTQPGFGSTVDVYGGDGGMCFIDQLSPQFQIVSYVFNNFALSTNGGNTFPTMLIDDDNTGSFINKGDYDSNQKILYTARNSTSIYRVRNVTTSRDLDNISISLGNMASAFRVSRFTTNASTLFVGTTGGRLFKITNAGTSPSIAEITGPFPLGSISSIALGASENQLLVTFYNYGVVSIWESRNGGATWTSREGNLPNMPVRWAEYHSQNSDQVFIATELGVWSTENVNVASPIWSSTNGGLANVRTDMLRLRSSDGTMMASTYGRGVFTATIPSQVPQSITFPAITEKTLGNPPFTLAATASSGLAVAYSTTSDKITINGSQITLVKAGRPTITASQAGNLFFSTAPTVNQSFCIKPAKPVVTLSNNDTATPTLTSSATAGNQWFRNGTAINGATNVTFTVITAGIYKVQVTVDDCISEFSNDMPLIITGDINTLSNSISASPNPATDWLTVTLGQTHGMKDVSIYQLDGRRKVSQVVGGSEARFNVADYAEGIYIIKVRTDNSEKSIRFVKQ